MNMLTWFAISGILIFITSAAMAIIMLVQRETRVQGLWGVFCILVAFWGIGAYQIGIAKEPETALFWWKFAYIGVIFIPIMFTHFVYEFLGIKYRWHIPLLYAIGAVYLAANLMSSIFIGAVHSSVGGLYFMTPTPLYNTYMLAWILLIPYAHILLYREFIRISGTRRRQIQLFFLGSFIGFFGGSFSFLPEYNINIYPYPNLAVSLYPLIMGYAILRYHLWNFKVVVTRIAVLSLWIFLAARVILSPFGSQDQIIDIILLLLTVVVGILLIRSVDKEIKQRETIEEQAKNLELANREQESLLHFISHEIKGYLTKSEAGFASIVEGDYGHIPENLKSMSWAALGEVRKGVATVMDILDASNLKKGTVSYRKETFDFKKAVLEIVSELKQTAAEKGLEIKLSVGEGTYTVVGDEEKLRLHAIRNLIDNAIKYTPEGFVLVKLSDLPAPRDATRQAGGEKIHLSVTDSGVGITSEDMQNLFTEGGHGKNSIKINVHSTGYGLYIARKIIEAHGGRVWAESEGEGKGSTFTVELPAAA